MKSYLVASLGALAAASAIALGAAPADGAAVELALSGAAARPMAPMTRTPSSLATMARRAEGGWLLRVMTGTAPHETLCPLPGAVPVEPDSL